MTARLLLVLGEAPDRYELVNGVVLMSPSDSFRHNDMIAELITELRMFARKHPGTEVVPATDDCLSDREVYRPYVLACRAGRFGVGKYRAVDPSVGNRRRRRRKGCKMVESRVTGTSVRSTGLPGCTLDLA